MTERYAPLYIETSKLKIIVFGGGNVALRKCRYFEGSDITVMAKEILPELESIVSKTIVGAIPDDLKGLIEPYDLVMAATDNKELNCRIRDQALSMGVYVNSAHGGGNVLIPSVLEREGYSVAVSSKGKVPAFPPYVVEELDSFLDERFDRMFDLMAEMRGLAMKNIPTQPARKEFLQSVINDPEIRKAVAEDRMGDAREMSLKKG